MENQVDTGSDFSPCVGPGDEPRSDAEDSGILCADMDAMFAAIEIKERGLPPDAIVIVGGRPESRGVVSTCSYSARAFGVHSAMPSAQARRLCPQAIFIHPEHDTYSEYSRRIMAALRRFGPIEQVSIDEAFVDVGAAGLTLELGQEAKDAVRREAGLICSVGLASTKLVSKIASSVKKPDGLVLVPPGLEPVFLAPLPVGKLWGVGPKTADRLREFGIEKVADLVATPLQRLTQHFGQHLGVILYQHARGIDESRVVTYRDPKRFSVETTFAKDVSDRQILWGTLRKQATRLAERLQHQGTGARTVGIKLRYSNFETTTRGITLTYSISDAQGIARVAAGLMRANWQTGQPLRLIGVACSNFQSADAVYQPMLPGFANQEWLINQSITA